MNQIKWTNESVKLFSGEGDPVEKIVENTRSIVFDAIDNGWNGPPFDPFLLANMRDLIVVPKDGVNDARLIQQEKHSVIEYNPNMSKRRIRFSIAHEIAHSFFPDYREQTHHRAIETSGDQWQLELLCNIAAAEILMPAFRADFNFTSGKIDLNTIILLHNQYNVSMEAMLIRVVKITNQPFSIFGASKENDESNADFRIDYIIHGNNSKIELEPGVIIPSDSILSHCTAVGYTESGYESWGKHDDKLKIECIGAFPYPNSIYPRILGILRKSADAEQVAQRIKFEIGDVLDSDTRGSNPKIIAHIVNDKGHSWGRGLGLAVAKKWPSASENFLNWITQDKSKFKLGNSCLFSISEKFELFSMIAQHGYGKSPNPRIRYKALKKCLQELARLALEKSAEVHMPRIGTGYAGGNWSVIQELIQTTLISKGINVTIYDLPGREPIPRGQMSLLDFV